MEHPVLIIAIRVMKQEIIEVDDTGAQVFIQAVVGHEGVELKRHGQRKKQGGKVGGGQGGGKRMEEQGRNGRGKEQVAR